MDHQPQGMQHRWHQHPSKYYLLLVPLLPCQQESIFFHKTLPGDLSRISKYQNEREQVSSTHTVKNNLCLELGANLGNHPNTDHSVYLLSEPELHIMMQLNSVFGAIIISLEKADLLTSEASKCVSNRPGRTPKGEQRLCIHELYSWNMKIWNTLTIMIHGSADVSPDFYRSICGMLTKIKDHVNRKWQKIMI